MSSLDSVSAESALGIASAVAQVDAALGRPPFRGPFPELICTLKVLAALLRSHFPELGAEDAATRRRKALDALVAPGSAAATALKTTLPVLAMAFPKGSPSSDVIDPEVLALFVECMSHVVEVSAIPVADLVKAGLQHLRPHSGALVLLAARSGHLDFQTARFLLQVVPIDMPKLDTAPTHGITAPVKHHNVKKEETKKVIPGKGPMQSPHPKKATTSKDDAIPPSSATCPTDVLAALFHVVLTCPDVVAKADLIELLKEHVLNDRSFRRSLRGLLVEEEHVGCNETLKAVMDDASLGVLDSLVVPYIADASSMAPILALRGSTTATITTTTNAVEKQTLSNPSSSDAIESAFAKVCLNGLRVAVASGAGDAFPNFLMSLGLNREESPPSAGRHSVGAASTHHPTAWDQPSALWAELHPQTAVLNVHNLLRRLLVSLGDLCIAYPPPKSSSSNSPLLAFISVPDDVLAPLVMSSLIALSAVANAAVKSPLHMKALILGPIELAALYMLLLLSSLYIPRLPTLLAATAAPSGKALKKAQQQGGAQAKPAVLPDICSATSSYLFTTISAPLFSLLWMCKFSTRNTPLIAAPHCSAETVEKVVTSALRVALSRRELILARLLSTKGEKGDGLTLEQSHEIAHKMGAVAVLLIELYKRLGALVSLSADVPGVFGPIQPSHPLGVAIGLALASNVDAATGATLRGLCRHWLRFILESRTVSLVELLDCANHPIFTRAVGELEKTGVAATKKNGPAKKSSGPTKAAPGNPVFTNIVADTGDVTYSSTTDKLAMRTILMRSLRFGSTDKGARSASTNDSTLPPSPTEDESIRRLQALVKAIHESVLGKVPRVGSPRTIDLHAFSLFANTTGAAELLYEVYEASVPASLFLFEELFSLAEKGDIPNDLLLAVARHDLDRTCGATVNNGDASFAGLRGNDSPAEERNGVGLDDRWGDVVTNIEELKQQLIATGYATPSATTSVDSDLRAHSQRVIDEMRRRHAENVARMASIAEEQRIRSHNLQEKLKEQERVQEAVRAAFEARAAAQEGLLKEREARRTKALANASEIQRARRHAAEEKRKLQLEAAREREGLTDSLLEYLESVLQLPRFEALTTVNRLRPSITHLSSDDVHEFLVTGHPKVPTDMLSRIDGGSGEDGGANIAEKNELAATERNASAVRSAVRERYFAEANGEVSFWDVVDQATRDDEGSKHVQVPKDDRERSAAEQLEAEKIREKVRSMSFHYRVAQFLDAFDYSLYDPATNTSVPPLTRDAVQAVFPREVAKQYGFFDAGVCAFELSHRRLLSITKGVYTLTPLGAAYHARFADHTGSFEAHRLEHLEKARAALGLAPALASHDRTGDVDANHITEHASWHGTHKTPLASPEHSSDSDADDESDHDVKHGTFFFTDELI